MGVDSHIVCLTDEKDIDIILDILEKSIQELTDMAKRKDPEKLSTFDQHDRESFYQHTFGRIRFTYLGEERQIFLTIHCDTDFREEFGEDRKLILSIGTWGYHEEIIKYIAHSFRQLGPVHTRMRDDGWNDESFVEMTDKEYHLLKNKTKMIEKMSIFDS